MTPGGRHEAPALPLGILGWGPAALGGHLQGPWRPRPDLLRPCVSPGVVGQHPHHHRGRRHKRYECRTHSAVLVGGPWGAGRRQGGGASARRWLVGGPWGRGAREEAGGWAMGAGRPRGGWWVSRGGGASASGCVGGSLTGACWQMGRPRGSLRPWRPDQQGASHPAEDRFLWGTP